ncbi:unnamed protein product [Brachionus calyciflorus]|uniref:Uncharacterized protein n=1 Tax=Brachionus calyciflorus TaxID=104777 RepID=A0A813YH30_9BILA|nr:unnamed protein product [Brachionus calyciflorus]
MASFYRSFPDDEPDETTQPIINNTLNTPRQYSTNFSLPIHMAIDRTQDSDTNEIGWCFLIFFNLALSITSIVLGSKYIHSCPVDKKIPVWLIVVGVAGLLWVLFSVLEICEIGLINIFRVLIKLFYLIWSILGMVWVISIRNIRNNDADSEFFCNSVCYGLVFGYVICISVVLGLIFCFVSFRCSK